MNSGYGMAEFAYDAAANPSGFTTFSQYGGFGDFGAAQAQGHGHPSLKQLKRRLHAAEAAFRKARSSGERAKLHAQIVKLKKHIAQMKGRRSGNVQGSSGHSIRGRSGPGVHGNSGRPLFGSSGRSNRMQRNAIRRFRSGGHPQFTKTLRQGQQQGEQAYSQDDSGELTEADLSMDLEADGLEFDAEDVADPGEYAEASATAGWGNWGMGNAFGSAYVTLYAGMGDYTALYGATQTGIPTTTKNALAQRLHALKVKLHQLEQAKKAAKGAKKKTIKDAIKHVKAQIKVVEKQLKSKGHLFGIGRKKDARSVAVARRRAIAKKAVAHRAQVIAQTRMGSARRALVPHGRLRFPRMQYGPTGPVPPPGVFLPGQGIGERAWTAAPERGGNINDYFDTSMEGQALTPGGDYDVNGGGPNADGGDDDAGGDDDSDTDWGTYAKWGLGIGAVIAVVAILSKNKGKKSKSKSSSSSYSGSDSAAA